MIRQQTFLVTLITILSIACLALIIVVARLNQSSHVNESTAPMVQTNPGKERTESSAHSKSTTEQGREEWEINSRLPEFLLPLHYDLYLHPDLEDGTFKGRVSIDIMATKPVDYLLVHVKGLSIQDTLLEMDGAEILLNKTFEYPEHQFWVVVPETQVIPGNYSLKMIFHGSLTNGITGFYKSVYKNSEGENIPIATSKFQPTDARKAFPCFDEPSFKSTFTVTLVRPTEEYIALSNMPVQQEIVNQPSAGLTEVKFERSVPMVTYLACFIVCNFEYEEKITSIHQTKFRVYATPEQKSRVKYSLDIGANITDFFTDYYDIPYPLPKQDMIAIPDFVSGAMEHWGLITYRETNLLYDKLSSSSSNQQRVATVVSHELAHMWFGNLVTLKWWDDLWLNEGFASYMEYKGVANYHPEWEMEAQFLYQDLHDVMDLDAQLNSHPIVQEVKNPNQITELFDRISYGKGASVLRMLENFMGAEEFRQGIHNFLESHKYGHAVTADLWRALESVSSENLPIQNIMDTWTRQMGYPVLTVTKVAKGKYRVTQERFLTDRNSSAGNIQSSPYGYKWDVPVSWTCSNNNQTELKWLERDESLTEISCQPESQWIKVNVGQFGFYRVNYSPEQWATLALTLVNNPDTLGPMDRASLLSDAFSLAESGMLNYDIPLSMTAYLSQETHLVPWETVYTKLVTMAHLLENTPVFPAFRKYIVDLVSNHYNRLGWRNDGTHLEKLNRNNILSLACRHGLNICNEEASTLFSNWIQDPSVYITPNIRALVYKYGMAGTNDPSIWETMFEKYLHETNAQEKAKLLYGLAFIKEPWVLQRFIKLASNETLIRSQDYFTALSYISRNPIGNDLVWNYIQSEWSNLVERFGLHSRYLGRLPKTVVQDFTTEYQLSKVKEFFNSNPEAGAGARARKQALESIENNIKWLNNHYESIASWINRN